MPEKNVGERSAGMMDELDDVVDRDAGLTRGLYMVFRSTSLLIFVPFVGLLFGRV